MDLRESILGAEDCRPEAVAVPEWNATLHVRPLTGLELLRFEEWTEATKCDQTTKMARLVVLCVVDEAGGQLFKDGDEQLLARKSGTALMKVFLVAARLNGMVKGAAEALLGNSVNGRSDALLTA